MSLFKLTITLAPIATGSAAAALFALHELDARTKLVLKVVVTLGAIATFLGIIIEGSEIIDWLFDSQPKIRQIVTIFGELPVETQRGVVATILTAVVFGTSYCALILPRMRPIVFSIIAALFIGVTTYYITERLRIPEAEKYIRMGQHFYDTGDYEASIYAFNRAIQLYPTAGTYERLGHIFDRKGLKKEAIISYTRAIELEPSARLYRALADVELSDSDSAAINDLTKAIELEPKSDEYYMRALLLERSNRLKEAADDYSRVIELEPFPCRHFDRGKVYLKMGEKWKAIQDFTIDANISSVCQKDARDQLWQLGVKSEK